MDLQVEMHISEDGQIHLVLWGQADPQFHLMPLSS